MVWDANTYHYDFKGTDFETSISNWRRMDMLRYALSPVWVIGISTAIFTLVKTGMVIIRVEFNTSMLFKIIFLGFIFISLPFWIKSVWLILFKSGYTPEDVKNFFPGSIVPLLDISEMREIMISTLANINIYHIGFMLFTSWQLSVHSSLNYFRSFMLLIFTYGIGIVLLRCIILVITF